MTCVYGDLPGGASAVKASNARQRQATKVTIRCATKREPPMDVRSVLLKNNWRAARGVRLFVSHRDADVATMESAAAPHMEQWLKEGLVNRAAAGAAGQPS